MNFYRFILVFSAQFPGYAYYLIYLTKIDAKELKVISGSIFEEMEFELKMLGVKISAEHLENWYRDGKFTIHFLDKSELPKVSIVKLAPEGLSLPYMKLESLPEWIDSMKNLRELDVSSNSLSDLPRWLLGLEKLEKLVVPNNQLSSLPSWFSQLQSLNELIISDNNFNVIPECLKQMPNLKHLNFSNNQIKYISGYWYSQLLSLKINCNPIRDLPPIPENCGMRRLKIGYTQLKNLPGGIFDCIDLEELDIFETGFEITSEISKLKNLKRIRFNCSNIDDIPLELLDLPNLEEIVIGKYLIGKALSKDGYVRKFTSKYPKILFTFWIYHPRYNLGGDGSTTNILTIKNGKSDQVKYFDNIGLPAFQDEC